MSNPTCKVHTLRTIRVTEPNGSVREYAKGFEFDVSPELADEWVADGAALMAGGVVVDATEPQPLSIPQPLADAASVTPKRSAPKPRASARIETPNPKTEDAPEIPAARPLED